MDFKVNCAELRLFEESDLKQLAQFYRTMFGPENRFFR